MIDFTLEKKRRVHILLSKLEFADHCMQLIMNRLLKPYCECFGKKNIDITYINT